MGKRARYIIGTAEGVQSEEAASMLVSSDGQTVLIETIACFDLEFYFDSAQLDVFRGVLKEAAETLNGGDKNE